jgi:hypothetical protein
MRTAWFLVIIAAAAAAGCVELPLLRDDVKPTARGNREQPVTAAEVSAANAREIADALGEELDRDLTGPRAQEPSPAP